MRVIHKQKSSEPAITSFLRRGNRTRACPAGCRPGASRSSTRNEGCEGAQQPTLGDVDHRDAARKLLGMTAARRVDRCEDVGECLRRPDRRACAVLTRPAGA